MEKNTFLLYQNYKKEIQKQIKMKGQTQTKIVRDGSVPPIKEEKKIVETPSTEENKKEIVDEKKKKTEAKPKVKIVKKDEAVVNGISLTISHRDSQAVCRFIKHKKIDNAIADLEKVLQKKKAVPMKGEIPHRKGKGMMSGRYPQNVSKEFIRMLKNLKSNATMNGIENPVVTEAYSNLAARPFGKHGAIRHKRAHIVIKARERKVKVSDEKIKKTKEKK